MFAKTLINPPAPDNALSKPDLETSQPPLNPQNPVC